MKGEGEKVRGKFRESERKKRRKESKDVGKDSGLERVGVKERECEK